MKFKEVIYKYKNLTGLSQASIAKESGLAPAAISRYLKGERTPVKNSESINALAKTFYNHTKLSDSSLTLEGIVSEFNACEEYNDDKFNEKFDSILTKYNIKTSALARAISMDNSFVSRIRSGKRSPKDVGGFVMISCRYISEVTGVSYEELLAEFTREVSKKNQAEAPKRASVEDIKKTETETNRVSDNHTSKPASKTSEKQSSVIKTTPVKTTPVKTTSTKRTAPAKEPGLFDMLGYLFNPGKKPGSPKRTKRPR